MLQEFIAGQNLAEELEEHGAFEEKQIRQLLENMLPVLSFVHEQQVIHRDIKPANIIRRSSNDLVLVDFGAAKLSTGTSLEKTGTVIGSAAYAAPEQAMGKATFASDLYSLGVTCIHLFTNVNPFDLYSTREGKWVWQDYIHTPCTPKLERILNKMLEGGTSRRYQSAVDILNDLHQQPVFEKPEAIASPSEPLLPQPQTPKTIVKKNKCVAACLAIFLGFWGAHRFYLGETRAGVICAIFSWTYIPFLFSLGDFVRFLFMSEKVFDEKYNPLLSSPDPLLSPRDTISALSDLKKLYDEGIITAAEYEEKRQKLLTKL